MLLKCCLNVVEMLLKCCYSVLKMLLNCLFAWGPTAGTHLVNVDYNISVLVKV